MDKMDEKDKRWQIMSLYSHDLLSIKIAFNSLIESTTSTPSLQNFKQLGETSPDLIQRNIANIFNYLKDKGFTWMNFIDILIDLMANSIDLKTKQGHDRLDSSYNIRLLTHNHRASSTRIIRVLEPRFLYITISKLGTIGILDYKMKLESSYKVDLSPQFSDKKAQVRKRGGRLWVTDACHMTDCQKLVLSTNIRTLWFYDISATTHLEEFMMYGISSNATCLHYHFENEMQSQDNRSFLFFGDSRGYIHCLQFKQQHNGLFKKLDMTKTTKVFFLDLESHRDYVNYQLIDRNHKTAILQIKFIPQNCTLISCCEGYSEPLIIRDMRGYLKMYIFRQPKGVQCFDHHYQMQILVTGGRSGLINVWNPYVIIRPSAILPGHETTVIDVRIVEQHSIILSYSKNMELKLWDLVYYYCIQTITLKFPIDLVSLNAEPEHPNRPIHLETFHENSILIQCRDYVFQLQKSRKKAENQPTIEVIKETDVQPSNMPINEEQILSEKYKNSSLTEILEDAVPIPTVATIVSSNTHLLDSADLSILADQLFSLETAGVNRKDMKNGVLRGLPFSTLKLVDVEPITAKINIPRLIDNSVRKISLTSKRLDLHSVNCIPKVGASINLSSRRPSLAINGSLVTQLPLTYLDNASSVGTQSRRSSKTTLFAP